MTEPFYSIRMHASRQGRHLSGGEHLTEGAALETLAASLVRRALEHPRGRADRLQLTVEEIAAGEVRRGRLPDLRTIPVSHWRAGRGSAARLLAEAGVATVAIEAALSALAAGAGPGGVAMRGAMLVDAASGARLEADPARGVRVSRMDLTAAAGMLLRQQLQAIGLDNPHVREALVLAGKVLAAPGVVAELCWSDDPGYTAGYVASSHLGYVRLPHLKPYGEERGGRAFFIRPGVDLAPLVTFLETVPVLFDQTGVLRGEASPES